MRQPVADTGLEARAGPERLRASPLHLLRLVSPNQPVGGFSYSRGLEWAVHAQIVTDAASCADWIIGLIQHSYATLDGALFWRMMQALQRQDDAEFERLNDWLSASRESHELELEDRRMAESLMSLLRSLNGDGMERFRFSGHASYPAVFAIAAHQWGIAAFDALRGLMWAVVESQVTAAIRLVPLGHTAGQRILISAVDAIETAAQTAATLSEEDIGNMAPALAMASAWHETQYSRLFRS
ncbi:urease accessory protein UreF [Ochrobactrum sp. AN78]|uniref:urease accessory protein UreF n=1 Tax=Ochrobactrum sp. AN78 TaxID=3039853 RepID=UPI002989E4CB|nr:urease accessory UreF family protein [Ochrobactrum sp. AN78]MDH7793143.1 urease accessory protein [Ochrobactrum sp. AN78]